jgi:hypothetical protein
MSQLPAEYGDGSAMFDIFDHFGTHTIESAKMGSRYGFSSYFYELSWLNVLRTATSVTAAASYEGLFKSGVKTKDEKTHAAQVAFDQSQTDFEEISLGSKPSNGSVEQWAQQVIQEPMPISYSLRSLCETFTDAGKKANCHKAQTAAEYCTKRLLNERKDLTSCRDADDIECKWDGDCHGGHVCVKEACVGGALQVAWRPQSNLCLELDGSQVKLGTCKSSQNQKWIFNSAEKDNYMQIQYAADTSKCVDAGNMNPGTSLTVQGCKGSPSQTWARDQHDGAIFTPNGPPTLPDICMDAGSGIGPGKALLVWGCNKLPQQQYDLRALTAENAKMVV